MYIHVHVCTISQASGCELGLFPCPLLIYIGCEDIICDVLYSIYSSAAINRDMKMYAYAIALLGPGNTIKDLDQLS